jgi:hypothetical protein
MISSKIFNTLWIFIYSFLYEGEMREKRIKIDKIGYFFNNHPNIKLVKIYGIKCTSRKCIKSINLILLFMLIY